MSADTKTSIVLQAVMTAVDEALTEITGEHMGIVLMTFPLGRPGMSNYISNGNRDDMKVALTELLKRWEGGMADIPAHHKN